MQTMRIALLLLLQPVLVRRTMGKPWAQWLMLGISAGFSLWAVLGRAQPAAGLAVIVGTGQLVLWWAIFIISIGLQFAQDGTRLVPHLRRIALATIALVWFCLVSIIVLAAGGVFGHHALWALMAGLGLVAVAMLVAGRWECLLFTPLVLMVWIHSGDSARIAALLTTPAGMAGGAALLCASMFYTLRLLLGKRNGASVHGRFMQMWGHAVSGMQAQQGPLKGHIAAVYAACLRRDCARRDMQNLLLHGLGPSLHWSPHLGMQIPSLLTNAVLAVLVRLQQFPSLTPGLAAGIFVGSMISSQFFMQMAGARIAAGQPEQALLRLAPGMPMSNELNRMLARGLLGLFMKNWIANMGILALLLALAGVSQTFFIETMATMSVSVLFMATGMLRNFALANKRRERIVLGLLIAIPIILMIVLMAVLQLAPVVVMQNFPGMSLSGVALLFTLPVMPLAGLVVWWRWRAMLAAPPAFPSARIEYR